MPTIQTIRKPATSVRKGKLPDPNTYKIVYILVDQYLGGTIHIQRYILIQGLIAIALNKSN